MHTLKPVILETSHLICIKNQMTGFYIKWNTDLMWIRGMFFRMELVACNAGWIDQRILKSLTSFGENCMY